MNGPIADGILVNAAQCLYCGAVCVSFDGRETICICGRLMASGGRSVVGRAGNRADWCDLTVVREHGVVKLREP